jgi:ribose transport system ATP-binding protein
LTTGPGLAATTAEGDQRHNVALAVERLSKTFGATRALRDVSVGVNKGRIHGLVGGNGSGKSTLIKVLAGVHRGDAGGIVRVGGEEVPADEVTPATAMRCGLRFVHQDPATFPGMTVAENFAIGSVHGFPRTGVRIAWRELRSQTQEALDRFEIRARPDDPLERLAPAQRTMVAIARALRAHDERGDVVLVLDEPTASLPEHEVDTLLDAIRRCAAAGETILYVSHRLEEVLSIIDEVTVLRDGAVVMTATAVGMTTDDLIEAIVGGALEVESRTARDRSSTTVLDIEKLQGGPLTDVSLRVAAGEIVGIAGLLGSGRSELLQMVFGALEPGGGRMLLDGAQYAPAAPGEAMEAGVAFVPEDRSRDAAFPDLSVSTNLGIARLDEYRSRVRLDDRRMRADATDAIARFGIRCPHRDAPLSALSGGNQQKTIVARWLRRNPKLFLMDEPTHGVDVGARQDLYRLIEEGRAKGMAVLMVSSDLDELAQVCDRVLVLRDGRVAGEAQGPSLTAHRLSAVMYGEQR